MPEDAVTANFRAGIVWGARQPEAGFARLWP